MRSIRALVVVAVIAAALSGSPTAHAVASAGPDFDGDGFADLALGAPGERLGSAPDAGVVHVLYGTAVGLSGAGSQFFQQGGGGALGITEAGDSFGEHVAWGNFDGDAYDDLAIAAPREDLGDVIDAGAVFVMFGAAAGLDPASTVLVVQGVGPFLGVAEPGDLFGSALATGDFDADGADDLAIGARGEDVGRRVDAGAVLVVLGTPDDPVFGSSRMFTQDSWGVPGASETGDLFGWALAAGNLGDPVADGVDPDDLVIGVPREDVGDVVDAGAATVLFGRANAIGVAGARLLTQATPGVPDDPEFDDRFGHALAIGPLAGGGYDDLAVGSPGEVVIAYESEGSVSVLPSPGASGPTGAGASSYVQGVGGVGGGPFELDSFGAALEIADVAGDANDELIVGVPYDSVAPKMYAGSFHILAGTPTGPTGVGSAYLQQGSNGVPGALETADSFGFSLWSGDYDGDGHTDLVVGAHTEDHSGAIGAGIVIEFENDGVGVPNGSNRIWSQQSSGVAGTAELHDNFGRR